MSTIGHERDHYNDDMISFKDGIYTSLQPALRSL